MITIFFIIGIVRNILQKFARAHWEFHAPCVERPAAAVLQTPSYTLWFSSPNTVNAKSSRNDSVLWKMQCCLMSSWLHLCPLSCSTSLGFSYSLLENQCSLPLDHPLFDSEPWIMMLVMNDDLSVVHFTVNKFGFYFSNWKVGSRYPHLLRLLPLPEGT